MSDIPQRLLRLFAGQIRHQRKRQSDEVRMRRRGSTQKSNHIAMKSPEAAAIRSENGRKARLANNTADAQLNTKQCARIINGINISAGGEGGAGRREV